MITTAKRIERVEEYYFSRKLQEVRKLDTPEKRVINLGIGSPDQPPSASTIDALVGSARKPGNHSYQSYRGIAEFRKAIAGFYEKIYKVKPDPETMILPLIGSKEGIMHITLAFVNEGDTVLIPDPGYPTYGSVANLVGAKVIPYTMKESLRWGIDMDALKKQDLSKVKLMWVNFPHMPTGRIASREELTELVQLARENDFLLVNDNPYSLILNNSPLSILSIDGATDVAMELNSLSKSHNMAGWRLGWVAGQPAFIDAVLRVKSNMDSGMFLPLQHAAVQALNNDREWFISLNSMYDERRKIVWKILDVLDCTYERHQSGLFVWGKAPEGVADVELWIDSILYATKVFITPGFIFGENGRRYIRISLCNTTAFMNEALERVVDYVQKSKLSKTSIESTR